MHPSFKDVKVWGKEEEEKGEQEEKREEGEKRGKENYLSIINTKPVFQEPQEVSMTWNICYSLKLINRKGRKSHWQEWSESSPCFLLVSILPCIPSPIPLFLAFLNRFVCLLYIAHSWVLLSNPNWKSWAFFKGELNVTKDKSF